MTFPTALTQWTVDPGRPLKVCCSIWHLDVGSRSSESSLLSGGASISQIRWITSCGRSIGLTWGRWRPSQGLKLVLHKPFLNHVFSGACFSVKGLMVSNSARVGGTCQRRLHMDGRTYGEPEDAQSITLLPLAFITGSILLTCVLQVNSKLTLSSTWFISGGHLLLLLSGPVLMLTCLLLVPAAVDGDQRGHPDRSTF